MTNNVSIEMCAATREKCPGRRTLPIAVLVIILLALASALAGSHVLNSGAIAATREDAASTQTRVNIQAERQKSIDTTLDAVLTTVNRIDDTLNGKDATP